MHREESFSFKTPDEVDIYAFNFSDRLSTNETIDDADFTITSVRANDTTVNSMLLGNILVDGSSVGHMIGGGLANNEYLLRCVITTSEDRVLEAAGTLKIEDI